MSSKCSPRPRLDSPISSCSTSGLETPPRESSPIETDLDTPKVSRNGRHRGPEHGTTPVASGSSTPTAAGLMDSESKKAKPFLGLVNVPFAEFLRGRHPSSNQALLDVEEEVDEEDRKTIHAEIEERSSRHHI